MQRTNFGTNFRLGVTAAVAAVGLGLLLAPSTVLAAGDANESSCAGFTGTESSPGFRAYLPDCRAYELVSPPYKNGGFFPLEDAATAIAPDGQRVMIATAGAFAGTGNSELIQTAPSAAYELTRTSSGWLPTALTPSAVTYPTSTFMAASSDLSNTLWGASHTHFSVNSRLYSEDIYFRESDGALTRVGPGIAPEVAEEGVGKAQELRFAGASSDLKHVLLGVKANNPTELTARGGHSNVWPGDTTRDPGGSADEGVSLYEYVGVNNLEPRLVGVRNDGVVDGTPHINDDAELISECGTELGTSARERGDAYNAVSADGETTFFTAIGADHIACGGTEPAVDELYARVGGAHTVAISEPSPADCEACQTGTRADARFAGASEAGSKVLFTSTQPLLGSDSTENLYLYDFNAANFHEKLTEVSATSDPEGARVQGVVRISEDGSRVYFVAEGLLTSGKNTEGNEPSEGADNLYVYDTTTATMRFVATLLTPADESRLAAAEAAEETQIFEQAITQFQARQTVVNGELERGEITEGRAEELKKEAEIQANSFISKTLGARGPSGTLAEDRRVWQRQDARPAQATPDGRFLIFVSSADLTADDHSTVPQLFRYDATTEQLTRVSVGQGQTFNDNGNTNVFHEAPTIPLQSFSEASLPTARTRLAISDDGERVYFTAGARLTPETEANTTNVYEYHAGNVYLISDGHDASATGSGPSVSLFGIGSSGNDAFFTTADQLVPQAGETIEMLYDARAGGGLPGLSQATACEGDACQGALAPVPSFGAPASSGLTGSGNLAASPPPSLASKPAVKRKCVKNKRLSRGKCVCVKGAGVRHGKCVVTRAKGKNNRSKRMKSAHKRKATR
jgi:hypothetical protein